MQVRAFGRSAHERGLLPIVLCGLALRPNGAGVSTYIRQLLSALPRHFDGPTDVVVQADMVASMPIGITTRERPISSGVRRAIEGLRNPGPARLVHGLDVDLPALFHCPSVTTVHDLSVFDVPWAFSRRRAYGERLLVERAIRRCRRSDHGFAIHGEPGAGAIREGIGRHDTGASSTTSSCRARSN